MTKSKKQEALLEVINGKSLIAFEVPFLRFRAQSKLAGWIESRFAGTRDSLSSISKDVEIKFISPDPDIFNFIENSAPDVVMIEPSKEPVFCFKKSGYEDSVLVYRDKKIFAYNAIYFFRGKIGKPSNFTGFSQKAFCLTLDAIRKNTVQLKSAKLASKLRQAFKILTGLSPDPRGNKAQSANNTLKSAIWDITAIFIAEDSGVPSIDYIRASLKDRRVGFKVSDSTIRNYRDDFMKRMARNRFLTYKECARFLAELRPTFNVKSHAT